MSKRKHIRIRSEPSRLNTLKRMALAIPVSQLPIVAKTGSNSFTDRFTKQASVATALPTTACVDGPSDHGSHGAFIVQHRSSLLIFIRMHLCFTRFSFADLLLTESGTPFRSYALDSVVL
jgi:hypothetical protein